MSWGDNIKKPHRTCTVCRRKALKEDLFRFVWDDDKLVWDGAHKAPGRGGYVHKNWGCVGRMSEPRRWERVLKLSVGTIVPTDIQGAFNEVKVQVLGVEDSGIEDVARKKRNRIKI